MIVSIMQPYFFPYLGYFQLIHASDVFVAYDTVQYIRRGWINRNRILDGNGPTWLTLPVEYDIRTSTIEHRRYFDPDGRERQRLVNKLHGNYRRAPHFRAAMAVLEPLVLNPEPNIAAYNVHLLRALSAHLGIDTRFELASRLPAPRLGGTPGLLALCQALGARTYLNSIGGIALYDREDFAGANVDLRFLRSEAEPYPQFGNDPVGSLSIIDVLMFNDAARIAALLGQYRLVTG